MGPILPTTIEQNIPNFTGRAWLLPHLLKWLLQSDECLFILKGGPGTGKSMITAWLAGAGPAPNDPEAQVQLRQIRSLVKAVHFCIATSGNTSPRVLAQNMAEQLVRKVPGFGQALAATLSDQIRISTRIDVGHLEDGKVTGVYIEHLDMGGLSDEATFNRILREPLQTLYARGYDESILLLVDALDEAVTYSGKSDAVRLLSKLGDLPKQVRILATTRPDPRVRKLLRPFYEDNSLDLSEDAPLNVADVYTYVYERLAWLEPKNRRRFTEWISQAAGGNFLYAHLVVDDLISQRPNLPSQAPLALPKKLSGLYHEFLNRELGAKDREWFQIYQPILGLIAVAKGMGLNREQIERFTGQDVEWPLRVCKQYLDGDLPDGPFRPFHQSFTDFLLSDEDNLDYHIDAVAMHRKIVDYYWETYQGNWMACDTYGLRHILSHLQGAKLWKRLSEALDDLSLLEAQVLQVGVDALLLGLAEIVVQMGFESQSRQQAKDLLRVLDREAHNLRDWDPQQRPAFLAQQVRNRAVYEGFERIIASADKRLGQLKQPYLALTWRTYRESASMQRSLVVPEFFAMAVDILRDGNVLSGGTDRVLRVWDPQTGRLVSTLPQKHSKSIRDVAVTPDDRYAISASFDETLKVWDLEQEQMVGDLVGHIGAVRAVRVTPDGGYAISASDDATLRVWDISAMLKGGAKTDLVVHSLEKHAQPVWGIAVTLDGRQVVSVSEDGQLIVWDLCTGESVRTFRVKEAGLRSVAVIPGKNQVLVGDKQGVLTVLDLDSGETLATLEGHRSSVFGIAVTMDGMLALSASDDNTLRVWDLERKSLIQTLTGHGARVYDVAASPDGRWAISAATDAMLKIWRLERNPTLPKKPRAAAGHTATVRSLALTADAHTAVSAAQDGTLRVWEVQSGRLRHTLGRVDKGSRHGHGIALLHDGSEVISAAEDTTLRFWDLREGIMKRDTNRSTTPGEPGGRNIVRSLAVTPDGKTVVSAAADGKLTVWDLSSEEIKRTPDGHNGVVRTVTITADGKQAISGGADGTLKIWDMGAVTLTATLAIPGKEGSGCDVRAVTTMPDAHVLASYEDGTLIIWDLATRAIVSKWEGDDESVRGVAVMEDGRRVIVAGINRNVKVLDLTTGEEIAFVALEGSPRSIAFAQKEATILVGDRFGSVYCLHYVEA
jgi:WD40 repeat protein